jgi:hypothetical protein
MIVIFALSVPGCRHGAGEKILPPPEKRPEKQYITEIPQTRPEAVPAEPAAATTKTSVSTKEFQNVSKVEINGTDSSGFLNNDNFVTRWNILGPFACPAAAEPPDPVDGQSLLHRELLKNEKELSGSEAIPGVKWQLARFESPQTPGKINLRNFFKGSSGRSAAYAVTYLQCDEALSPLILYTGSSGYIKVWLNRQLIHAYDRNEREGQWDQDIIKNIKLRKSYNLLVVKCVATAEDWCFYLRLAAADNIPLKFVPVAGSFSVPAPENGITASGNQKSTENP